MTAAGLLSLEEPTFLIYELFVYPPCVCVCFCIAVLASFRGTVQHGLPLEIGDTVQILEKCEGMTMPYTC